MSKLAIKYRGLSEISLLEKNFKRHDLDATRASMEHRGVIDPIGFNPATGNAFDGNGRTETLRMMHADWLEDKTVPVPRGVTVKKDEWLVPTVDVEMTADEEVAAAAALNQINKLGGYDEAFQLEILQEMQQQGTMIATGFTELDLASLLKRFPDKSGAPDEGEPPPPLIDGENAGAGLGFRAVTSSIKQVSLLYAPDKHSEFLRLTVAVGKALNTNNASDTVLAALRKADEVLNG